MFGLAGLTKSQRLVLGVIVLIIVDLIWVASSELTKYLFKDEHFDKPYFSTYFKTAMFTLYLSGFLFWRPWRNQCRKNGVLQSGEGGSLESEELLTEPIYVPLRYDDKNNSGSEHDDLNDLRDRSVRFNNLMEVRQLTDTYAEEQVIARLSYQAAVRAEELRLRALSKLTIKQVAKMAFMFSILWFFANYSYQIALHDTEVGVVNVLSSTSSLFTLICAAIYPGSSADRFSLSKLVAVLVSISGVVMVSVSDLTFEDHIPAGALWALSSAILYAVYLVGLRRKVDHEDKLDIPLFFGFVGLFTSILLWPGFLILHYSKIETFQWPNGEQVLFIVINGLVGTVLSEFLWLWGCFLTSSLIATSALSLVTPLSMIADVVIKGVSYTWLFYLGSVPVFVAFMAVSCLTHFESWDPVLLLVKKVLHCLCSRRVVPISSLVDGVGPWKRKIRMRDVDKEQTESLIGVDAPAE
ncbi:solute carrier family 35 member F5-like isoform X1 [Mercenaria mercenaria]|uniref:solute carrier family 35 member F5-like isoform X1 n=1 Tax=Mercenaria mercenaria TaxID=6596 RepID=UPI001E1D485B|nr:solute carrier family 35 member F5-like isoform X1 [Mercenaria mercenaria]